MGMAVPFGAQTMKRVVVFGGALQKKSLQAALYGAVMIHDRYKTMPILCVAK